MCCSIRSYPIPRETVNVSINMHLNITTVVDHEEHHLILTQRRDEANCGEKKKRCNPPIVISKYKHSGTERQGENTEVLKLSTETEVCE